jgi:hypothetical protein
VGPSAVPVKRPRPRSCLARFSPSVPFVHCLPADTLALTGRIPTHLIDLTRFFMWTTPPVSFLGLDIRLEPKGSSLGFRGGLALFHTPCDGPNVASLQCFRPYSFAPHYQGCSRTTNRGNNVEARDEPKRTSWKDVSTRSRLRLITPLYVRRGRQFCGLHSIFTLYLLPSATGTSF